MRGRLINPFLADLSRLDVTATAEDPDGDGALTSGYHSVFREPLKLPATGSKVGADATRYKSAIRVPCQVEVNTYDALQAMVNGRMPDRQMVLVFHFMDLERLGLVDPSTGEALLRTGDRLNGIYTMSGALVQLIRTPPGLYLTQPQPNSFGIGLRRNLLLATFEERETGTRGA